MRILLGILLAGIVSSPAFADSKVEGKLYELGSGRKNLLYHFDYLSKKSGQAEEIEAKYLDPKGNVAVWEKVNLSGGKISQYVLKQHQLSENGELKVENNKVRFTYTKDGKTSTAEEDLTENFVVGPTLVPYIHSRWSDIQSGKTVAVRFGVPDRRETVGFDIKKTGQEEINGKKSVVIKVSASSFIIAMLVKPMTFKMSEDGQLVYERQGRAVPKLKVGEAWKDLDADTVYTHSNK